MGGCGARCSDVLPEIDKLTAAHDIEGLVGLLAGKPSVRRRASQELIGIGFPAMAPLVAALGTVGDVRRDGLGGHWSSMS